MRKLKRRRRKSVLSGRGGRRKRIAELAGSLALSLVLLFAAQAPAQDIDEAATIEDLGLLFSLEAGARAAGTSGACTSMGGDSHSLLYNPAGLSEIRRIELGIGFQHAKKRNTIGFFGAKNTVLHSTTNLDYIAAAYPFPTYRGSLVGAVGVYRVYSSDLDLLYSGYNPETQTRDNYRLQQAGSIYSYNIGFALDLSPNLSGGASFYFLDGTIDALTQFDYEYVGSLSPGEWRSDFLFDDARVDLDGYGGRLGIQFYPHRLFRFGIAVRTPTWINIRGDAYEEEAFYFDNAPDSQETWVSFIDTDYLIPFRIDWGMSIIPHPDMVFTIDLGYCDWTQTSINRVQIKDSRLRPVFRQVVDLRTGLEVGMTGIPLRIRGGYAYRPYPLKRLQADRISGGTLREAMVESERQIFSVGLGGLIGRVLTIDAAFLYISGERSLETLTDKRSSKRLLLSTSYRF